MENESRTGRNDTTESRSGGLILVADDQAEVRALIGLFLRRAGLRHDTAVDGAEALDRALATPYDAILLDVHLPMVDGRDVARRLREAGQTVPIVALTGMSTAEDRARCIEAGCNDFLAKPVTEGELRDSLVRWLPAPPSRDARELAESPTLPESRPGFDAIRQSFVDSLASYSRELGDSRNDPGRLEDLAHRLAGAAGLFGVGWLAELAGQLEAACKRPACPADLRRLADRLHERLNESPSPPA